MPVARIITRTPQDAELVVGQLRARGYTIEIVSPGAQRDAAELEIDLDICDPEEALRRARKLAQTGADVFVATGTFVIAEPTPAPADEQVSSPEPPARKVWEAEPELERNSLVRDIANATAPAARAALHRTREMAVASARRARALASSAVAGARTLTRDAAAAIAVQFAQRSEQRRQVRQRRQLQQAKTQRTIASRAVASPKPQPQPARLPVIRRTRSRDYEWRTAGVFSVALAIGITLAWAAANRRPATPVPASVIMRSNAMQQQVPFGPVTLPAPAKPRGQAANMPKARAGKPAAVRRPGPDPFGNEVVVRHFTPARTQPPARPPVAARRIIVND